MVDLLFPRVEHTGTIVNFTDTLVDLSGTIINLPVTNVDLSDTMVNLSGHLVDLFWKLLAQLSSFATIAAQHLSI
jgi:hypothetical protein